jgi:hypothetical protein
MPKHAAGHHKKATKQHEKATHHYKEAARHYDVNQHEKAAHHAYLAHGYGQQAIHHGIDAAKFHIEHHGNK